MPAINSASMPNRCLTIFSTPFLNSALAGTEITTFPFFTAGFKDSVPFTPCRLCRLCRRNTRVQAPRRDNGEQK